MEFKEFSNYYDVRIGDDDTMFEIACDIFSEHLKSNQTTFDVEYHLNLLEKKNPEIYQNKKLFSDLDVSLIVIAEIFATLKTEGKIFYYGSEDENDYISSEQLTFNKVGLKILLEKLTELYNAPADERDIFEEYSAGDEFPDPFLMSVIAMYIDMLSTEIT